MKALIVITQYGLVEQGVSVPIGVTSHIVELRFDVTLSDFRESLESERPFDQSIAIYPLPHVTS